MRTLLKIVAVAAAIACWISAVAQNNAYLDINNVKARFNSAGDLFWDKSNTQFFVPKATGKSTIFAGNLWIGGIDGGGQLHMAGQTYRQAGTDYFQGPVMSPNNYSVSQDILWNKVWKINKSTIDSFKLGYFSVPPPSIANWPGNGNTGLGQAAVLAPYADINSNGTYDPANGDYPVIRGDQAVFFLFNDDRNLHTETGGLKLGVEVHGMAYAFNCPQDSAFHNTLFIHYDIYNRSANNYNKTRFGIWTDFDIDYYLDDYVGCDTVLNAYYGYNGLGSSYNAAQGVVSLSHPMHSFMSFGNNMGATGNPTVDSTFYNLLNAKWGDGSHVTFGGNGYQGTQNTNYMYPGDPTNTNTWSEVSANNNPADKRGIGAYGNPNFNSGAVQSLDMAYVFAWDYNGTNLTAVNLMKQRVQAIQTAFNNNTTPCGGTFVGIGEKAKPAIQQVALYPNPATDQLFVVLPANDDAVYQVYDVTGQLVAQGELGHSGTIGVAGLASGIYLVKVITGGAHYNGRFVK